MKDQVFFRVVLHDSPRIGASAARSFLTARNTLCLAALVLSPSVWLISAIDRPFVVAQRERGAFERAELRPAPTPRTGRFRRSAPGVPARARRPAAVRRWRRGRRRGCNPGGTGGPAAGPPSSWRRCGGARCRSGPATRSAPTACRPSGSCPGPRPRRRARCRSSGRPAGRRSGCAARPGRERLRCPPVGPWPGPCRYSASICRLDGRAAETLGRVALGLSAGELGHLVISSFGHCRSIEPLPNCQK